MQALALFDLVVMGSTLAWFELMYCNRVLTCTPLVTQADYGALQEELDAARLDLRSAKDAAASELAVLQQQVEDMQAVEAVRLRAEQECHSLQQQLQDMRHMQ